MHTEEVWVLVGTQTGNAELVAEEIVDELAGLGIRASLVDMYDAVPEELGRVEAAVICTSTWGDGELPDNAVDFFEGLDAYRPDLADLGYGVLALGDHYYDPHYCAAGRMFENLLDGLGASRLVPSFDINEGPSENDLKNARAWTRDYALALSRRVPT